MDNDGERETIIVGVKDRTFIVCLTGASCIVMFVVIVMLYVMYHSKRGYDKPTIYRRSGAQR